MSGQSRFLQSTTLSQPGRARRGRLVTLTGLVVATLAVAGCGGNQTVQEMIGYDRSTPDEFAVMPRAPLAMPASMEELPPPTPGAPRPQEAQPREQAEAILFGQGQKVTHEAAPSAGGAGASAVLAKAGQAQPDIRTTVDQETTQIAASEDGLVDRLMFWNSKPLPGTVVDPYKESARLNTNAEAGKPLTTGDTPIIIRKRQAPLEGLVPSF
ncbi:DUF3035 domain-containing protein [Mycobacterium sp. KBS0706]|uniref:DUF3035 domain-containing protein n=1 Tax=Mycobacterium sp. KBS0706 TaxID=2578109 RepID=UPI00110FBD20|nr:DUF3035 domain-containing protein [Mycobacterium sp. KBS0706]TSD85041.1 DUF3035 domain-containing protein [Mycobacterium sp. KBS0706]